MKSSALGKYRLLNRLAVGGSAEVFLAEAVSAHGTRRVVLKQILPQYAGDPEFRRLFEKEARLLSYCHHPSIVELLDFGELDGRLFLALEHVEGHDLGTLLTAGRREDSPLPTPLAALIAYEVCLGLDHLHSLERDDGQPLGMVHRDISPRNILISNAGEVKLADFGIARAHITALGTTHHAVKGTFAYMAPEQAEAGGPIDARADLFALGAVLYKMLFGVSPFAAETESETLARVRAGQPRIDPGEVDSAAHPLLPIIARCLRRRPEDRFQTARALGRALQGFLVPVLGEASGEALSRWATGLSPSVPEERGGAGLGLRRQTAIIAGNAGVTTNDRSRPSQQHRSLRRRRAVLALVAAAVGGAVLVALYLFGVRAPENPRASSAAVIDDPSDAGAPLELPTTTSATSAPELLPAETVVIDEPPRRPAASSLGWLTVNSVPWAKVYIDGRRVGNTPLSRQPVKAGRHRVVLEDRHGRVLRSYNINVRRGRTEVVSYHMRDDERH